VVTDWPQDDATTGQNDRHVLPTRKGRTVERFDVTANKSVYVLSGRRARTSAFIAKR